MSAPVAKRLMPAEWSLHQATWISWPHNAETWPNVLDAAAEAMTELVTALAPHEQVIINVQDRAHLDHVANRLAGRVPDERVTFETIATDDAWIRDYGAILVHASDSRCGMAAVDFDYNAWGGKYPPYDRDRAVGRQMAERLKLPLIESSMVLEGGSVDVNGKGLGMVTEQCLLNPNRNPSLSRVEIESVLGDCLGLNELLWLGQGIGGDDTDGHVDNLARFVDTHKVAAIGAPDANHPDYLALEENRRRLDAFRDESGHRLEVIGLPMPAPVLHGSERMPASYANFYIANGIVLVPAFADPADDAACAILADCFPDREIRPIDCRALIVGLGALHCLTQQIPVIVDDSGQEE